MIKRNISYDLLKSLNVNPVKYIHKVSTQVPSRREESFYIALQLLLMFFVNFAR